MIIEGFKPADLVRRDTERLRRYREMLDFYHGSHWESRERRNEKRLTFNYAKVFVDKVTSYLMSGVSIVIEPVASATSPPDPLSARREGAKESESMSRRAERVLREVAEENKLEQLDFETEIDCAVLGDACYKVIWDPDAKRINISAPDVQGIYVWPAGDDASKVQRLVSKYSLNRETAAGLYNINSKEKTARLSGSSRNGGQASIVEVWTEKDFELWVDEARVEKKANPYGFIPFIVYPNLREPKQFWGVSDMSHIIEPQRELNRATSQLSKILELSGNPIAVLENVEESEDIAVRPGAVWNIPEDAKAYLLDLLQGGGVNLHIDYINLLYRILHDLSESPRAAFGGTERDLSGVALEIELQPLLQKVRRKRIIRTAVYIQRARMILKLLERFGSLQRTGPSEKDAADLRLRVVWGPVLPQDMTSLVANEQVLIQSGVHSRRRAMDEVGVKDPETEFSRWLEEREAILKMNRELNTNGKNGARVRAAPNRTEGIEDVG